MDFSGSFVDEQSHLHNDAQQHPADVGDNGPAGAGNTAAGDDVGNDGGGEGATEAHLQRKAIFDEKLRRGQISKQEYEQLVAADRCFSGLDSDAPPGTTPDLSAIAVGVMQPNKQTGGSSSSSSGGAKIKLKISSRSESRSFASGGGDYVPRSNAATRRGSLPAAVNLSAATAARVGHNGEGGAKKRTVSRRWSSYHPGEQGEQPQPQTQQTQTQPSQSPQTQSSAPAPAGSGPGQVLRDFRNGKTTGLQASSSTPSSSTVHRVVAKNLRTPAGHSTAGEL